MFLVNFVLFALLQGLVELNALTAPVHVCGCSIDVGSDVLWILEVLDDCFLFIPKREIELDNLVANKQLYLTFSD